MVVAGLLTASMLAGCSTASNANADKAPDEVETIKMAGPRQLTSGSIFYGQESGIFEEAGFSVEISNTASLAEAVPLLLNGDVQLTIIDVQNAILAESQGLPIENIAPLTVDAKSDGPIGSGNIVVRDDGKITKPSDLEGKTVGISQIGGLAWLTTVLTLQNQGVDWSTIKFVEVPGPRHVASLKQGQIDAVTMAEPYTTMALSEDGVQALVNADGSLAGLPLFMVAVSSDFAKQNEELVARMQEALLKAGAAANADSPKLIEIMSGVMDVPMDVLSNAVPPVYGTEPVTVDGLQEILDVMQELDMIKADSIPSDLSSILWSR